MKGIKQVIKKVLGTIMPTFVKRSQELAYWKTRKDKEDVFSNAHYEEVYTDFFGLSKDFFAGKSILDIGCGPRGSLEWADNASERVGVDPLANKYLKLGADKHAMTYISSPAESIPREDSSFDVVCAMNSLDHVEDVSKVVSEITRLTKTGGAFFLIVEINHPPTFCEPHTIDASICKEIEADFALKSARVMAGGSEHLGYNAIRKGRELPLDTSEEGWLVARFERL